MNLPATTHPAFPGVTISIEEFDVESAKQALARNSPNRKIAKSRVQLLADAMERGDFTFTGESVIFDRDDQLLNGQHRLSAVVKSGSSIWTVVVRGVDPDAFLHMDRGFRRLVGDDLRRLGFADYNSLAAATKLVLAYEANALNNNVARTLVANIDAQRREVLDSQRLYERCIEFATACRPTGINGSAMCAFAVLASRRTSIDETFEWLTRFQQGANMEVGDSRIALSRWLTDNKRKQNVYHLSALVFAWNAHRSGRPLKQIRSWRRGDPFPTISGNDGGGD